MMDAFFLGRLVNLRDDSSDSLPFGLRLFAALFALLNFRSFVFAETRQDLGDDTGAQCQHTVTQREPLAFLHHHGLQQPQNQPETTTNGLILLVI